MNARAWMHMALDPTQMLVAQGMTADEWQREVLQSDASNMLLNCSRGAGKTRVTSVLALHTALFQPGSLVLLVSRSLRQAVELLRYVKQCYRAIGQPLELLRYTETQMEWNNHSRIIALPGKEETIRGLQGVRLLILDEAARVPDILYSSVRPMVGTSGGRTICLSTPFGQRGFFWRAWTGTDDFWQKIRVTWRQCPRLSSQFIEQERHQFGTGWVAQEYECDFTSCTGLVYPDFPSAVVRDWPKHLGGQKVGGIDWGFRNPFAALWGVLDDHDILWIEGERYQTNTPLHAHAQALPPDVLWYADPAGATEIAEFRAAGHRVRKGNNDIRAGIQAVTARLQTGRLAIHPSKCPHLLEEARLYRYPQDFEQRNEQENPIDANNHALSALRYLVSRIDAHAMARFRRPAPEAEPGPAPLPTDGLMTNPNLWTTWNNG